MKKEMLEFIEYNHMLYSGDGVIVGVSGGADSVCLLHLLWCLREELGIKLRALHVHHGLRGEEADRDAEFTEEFCHRLGVPCEVVKIHADEEAAAQGISVEEAGRIARYRILEEHAAGWEAEAGTDIDFRVKIAVAHHGDDNAETILHNLFRGSGLKGLGGMPPVRERIIRPILWADREQILSYLTKENLIYVEDSTNEENDYTRNKLRNQILPLITSEINKQAVRNILQAGERIRGADCYFEEKATAWLERWSEGEVDRVPMAPLREEAPIVQAYIIREALKNNHIPLKDITSKHIEEIQTLLSKQSGKKTDLPYGISVEHEYGWLKFTKREKNNEIHRGNPPELNMKVFLYENQYEIPEKRYTKWFDYDKIKSTPCVRYRQTGDFIMLAGEKRKTVKAFMIDEKIPVRMREEIPLLADGSHILWIIGYRISEYYKVTEDTTNILEVQLDGGMDSGR
ncbi:MAG: tRNA lysidine(34) synthetase TilS [Clostridium sp.]